ncbi:MAG: hypothetical protein FWD49_04620 [Firmicutes bacterium]|nr:hypothetical protein [Bacillota bacterium]
MRKILLNGDWQFKETSSKDFLPAVVPGCNFSDLIKNNIILDPRIGTNEKTAHWVALKDWEYKKSFSLSESDFKEDFAELTFEMLDTLADIFINGEKIAEVKNANRIYTFEIKKFLKVGANEINVIFFSPLNYMRNEFSKDPLPFGGFFGEKGSTHLRKAPYHFGWDWGPKLPLSGIVREVYLNLYSVAKISEVSILQAHENGAVSLNLSVISTACESNLSGLSYEVLLSLNGETVAKMRNQSGSFEINIENPKLWFPNGYGEQPLYKAEINLLSGGKVLDGKTMNIGLREIKLNTDKDKFGRNFCFFVNGVRIFARGANWIATDSFISDTSGEKLKDLLEKAHGANMNMLRVWGGAYYESNEFYDLCDTLGLLVWQDFNFACKPYPFHNEELIKEIYSEVECNVKRLRHRASLALWAGNNEIESMSLAWQFKRKLIKDTGGFFYKTLPAWLREFDAVTPYWATSPSSGEYMKKINSDGFGDTHLWHVWHGLRPLEYYQKRKTRFCSEFGVESFPSLNALEIFANGNIPNSINHPVMKAHQKCAGGNSKMLFYILSKFKNPKNFLDLIYLSWLTQAKCVQSATEGWRIQKDRCNGSLYWQYNDCWGVCSWAGMDYYGNPKALHYSAKHFNAPLTAIIQIKNSQVNFYAVNDSNGGSTEITADYGIKTYSGKTLFKNSLTVGIKDCDSIFIDSLPKMRKKESYAFIRIYKGGEMISERYQPLTAENKAKLLNPNLNFTFNCDKNSFKAVIKSSGYASNIEIRIKGENAMLSDNYFNMEAGEKVITATLSKNYTNEELKNLISVRSLYDIEKKNGRLKDKLIKSAIFFAPVNFINYVIRFFDI